MTKVNVQLGDKARDTVSGFAGVCVARTEWLNGCWRMTLPPPACRGAGGMTCGIHGRRGMCRMGLGSRN